MDPYVTAWLDIYCTLCDKENILVLNYVCYEYNKTFSLSWI